MTATTLCVDVLGTLYRLDVTLLFKTGQPFGKKIRSNLKLTHVCLLRLTTKAARRRWLTEHRVNKNCFRVGYCSCPTYHVTSELLSL